MCDGMAATTTRPTVTRRQQTLVVGVLGALLLCYWLLGAASVVGSEDPLPLAVGLVMVVHAGVVSVHGRVIA